MRIVIVIALAGLTIYAVLCAVLYVKQEDFIFFRVANHPSLVRRWQSHRVVIPSADTVIEGWWADNPNSRNNLVILYFGGNAEDVLQTADSFNRFDARRMLVTNYRGYGATAGKPGEQALFADAQAIYDYAVSQSGVSADNIVAMGRSLGSGVATYLAAARPVRGVILVTPYDSLSAVAQAHYPFFPVRWLLRHRFASIEWAKRIRTPVLMLSAEQDNIVPPIHAQHLYDAWLGPKENHMLPSVGHNDIERQARYYPLINSFLAQRLVN